MTDVAFRAKAQYAVQPKRDFHSRATAALGPFRASVLNPARKVFQSQFVSGPFADLPEEILQQRAVRGSCQAFAGIDENIVEADNLLMLLQREYDFIGRSSPSNEIAPSTWRAGSKSDFGFKVSVRIRRQARFNGRNQLAECVGPAEDSQIGKPFHAILPARIGQRKFLSREVLQPGRASTKCRGVCGSIARDSRPRWGPTGSFAEIRNRSKSHQVPDHRLNRAPRAAGEVPWCTRTFAAACTAQASALRRDRAREPLARGLFPSTRFSSAPASRAHTRCWRAARSSSRRSARRPGRVQMCRPESDKNTPLDSRSAAPDRSLPSAACSRRTCRR